MNLTFVPLLETIRVLYLQPRDLNRFRIYLRMVKTADGTDLEFVPLVALNPMAKDHVLNVVNQLIAIEAERIARNCVEELLPCFRECSGDYRVGITVVDDIGGGWTNRYAVEYDAMTNPEPAKRGWISCPFWVSEPVESGLVRERIAIPIHRRAFQIQQGMPKTLRELLRQEGTIRATAGCRQPVLERDDLEYSRITFEPFLNSTDLRTHIECLFGDEAGATLGFTPRGLSRNAGLAVALADATIPVREVSAGIGT